MDSYSQEDEQHIALTNLGEVKEPSISEHNSISVS